MSIATENKLCEKCISIFQGHWQPYERNVDIEMEEQTEIEGNSELFSDTGEYEFYEQPQWVQSSAFSDSVTAFPATYHHSVKELKVSAANSCPLCRMIDDHPNSELDRLDPTFNDLIDRAVGVIDVHPSPINDTGVLDLDIIYFADGEVNKSSSFNPLPVHLNLLQANNWPNSVGGVSKMASGIIDISLNAINEWIQTCLNEHVDCWHMAEVAHSSSRPRGMPTRFLDLGTDEDEEKLQLVETSSIDPHSYYATLSHWWEEHLPVKLLKSTYSDFVNAINVETLPQTFRNAVTVTRLLNVQYLWIDALCIIQDSKDDWQRESLSMAMVYIYAYVDIAATSSIDSNGGLFHMRGSRLNQSCIINSSWTGLPAGLWICHDSTTYQRHIGNGPLNKRAWVFQERALAPRTIHFTKDLVWWECRMLRANDEFTEGVPSYGLSLENPVATILADFDEKTDIEANELWLSLVETNTAAKLSYDSDRLVSIAGIAMVIASAMKWKSEDYLAGLWKHDLRVDLLWRLTVNGTRKLNSEAAPSWSWASVKGEVYFKGPNERQKLRNSMMAEVINIDPKLVDGYYGSIRNGLITLHTHLYPIRLSNAEFDVYPAMTRLQFGEFKVDLTLDEQFIESLDEEELYHEFQHRGFDAVWSCFSTFRMDEDEQNSCSEGLILQLEQDELTGDFRRIGWLRLFHDDALLRSANQLRQNSATARNLTRNKDGGYVFKLV